MSGAGEAAGPEWGYDDLCRLLRVVDGIDRANSGDYVLTVSGGKIRVAVDDSDLFAWGYHGQIPIGPSDLEGLEAAYEDLHKAAPGSGVIYAPHLFLCRKCGERPQGAAYPKDPKVWSLFDACGPMREPGVGNPMPHPARRAE